MSRNLAESLRRAAGQLPEADYSYIANAPVEKMLEHDLITQQKPLKSNRRPVRLALASAFILVFAAAISLWSYQNWIVFNIIDIDVNPSFEITTNRKNKVLSVAGITKEAQEMLEGRAYRGWSVEDTVSTLLSGMREQGYLTAADVTVLLSAYSPASPEQLLSDLSDRIDIVFSASDTSPHLYIQQLAKNTDLKKQADKYDISRGKMQLVESMSLQSDSLLTEQLVDKTISELIALAEEEDVRLDIQETLPPRVPAQVEDESRLDPPADDTDTPQKSADGGTAPRRQDGLISDEECLEAISKGYEELAELYKNNHNGQYDEEIQRRQRELQAELNTLGDYYSEIGQQYRKYYEEEIDRFRDELKNKVDEFHLTLDNYRSIEGEYKDFWRNYTDQFRP